MMFEEDDAWEDTAPVGSFPNRASRYGRDDVVGNVGERTADDCDPHEETAEPPRGREGPREGDERALRGAGWNGALRESTRGVGLRYVYDLPVDDPRILAR